MSKNYRILIVDDHPFIIEAYKNALKSYKGADFEYHVTQANNCKTAYEEITASLHNPFDIAFLDISMPSYEEKNIMSGEDIAKMLTKSMPECKIILLTMHTELIKINNIIKEINPNGLIIKNDLTFDELLFAFDKILTGDNYYSQTVVKFVGQSQYDYIQIDEFDKQILYYLSKGTKTKDLTNYVPLSLSAIEKRKIGLKETLSIKGASDIELITEAKNKGLI